MLPESHFNVSDVITVTSNVMNLRPKWLTGMPVVVTTSGVLPTGISAATTYYVRRLSSTTISLYDSYAQAVNTAVTTGIRNITATGSGNHTITTTLSVRALGEQFGFELTGENVAHTHTGGALLGVSNINIGGGTPTDEISTPATGSSGNTEGITNMQPATVLNYIIKIKAFLAFPKQEKLLWI